MNPFEFVLVILMMIFGFSLIKHRMGIRNRWEQPAQVQDNQETIRLRDEVRELKERIKVLERITVEKENSLAKEIESLRDR
jgi:cell division protein FtsB